MQLTTDGHRLHLAAVEDWFGGELDDAMLVKIYGASGENETRYTNPLAQPKRDAPGFASTAYSKGWLLVAISLV